MISDIWLMKDYDSLWWSFYRANCEQLVGSNEHVCRRSFDKETYSNEKERYSWRLHQMEIQYSIEYLSTGWTNEWNERTFPSFEDQAGGKDIGTVTARLDISTLQLSLFIFKLRITSHHALISISSFQNHHEWLNLTLNHNHNHTCSHAALNLELEIKWSRVEHSKSSTNKLLEQV